MTTPNTKGTDAFKAWWAISASKRPAAKPIMAELQAACKAADERLAAIDADPFGLPPVDVPAPEDFARAEAEARAAIEAQDAEGER